MFTRAGQSWTSSSGMDNLSRSNVSHAQCLCAVLCGAGPKRCCAFMQHCVCHGMGDARRAQCGSGADEAWKHRPCFITNKPCWKTAVCLCTALPCISGDGNGVQAGLAEHHKMFCEDHGLYFHQGTLSASCTRLALGTDSHVCTVVVLSMSESMLFLRTTSIFAGTKYLLHVLKWGTGKLIHHPCTLRICWGEKRSW